MLIIVNTHIHNGTRKQTMASEIKKYVSVDETDNIVQGVVNFPDGKLNIQDGEQYKDINDVFIKIVSLVGAEGSEPINAEVSDGKAEININELDVEELNTERLFVGDVDMNRFMSNLASAGGIGGVETIDEAYTLGDIKDKYNALAGRFNQLLAALANVTSSGS